jgi:hypothetical protein
MCRNRFADGNANTDEGSDHAMNRRIVRGVDASIARMRLASNLLPDLSGRDIPA